MKQQRLFLGLKVDSLESIEYDWYPTSLPSSHLDVPVTSEFSGPIFIRANHIAASKNL